MSKLKTHKLPSIYGLTLLINIIVALILVTIFLLALAKSDMQMFYYLIILALLPGTQPFALGLAVYILIKNKKQSLQALSRPKFIGVVIAVILLVLLTYRIFDGPSINKYFIPSPLEVQSTSIENLKESMNKKVKYITDNSGLFKPYNKKRNELLQTQIAKAGIGNLFSIQGMLSNNNAGLAPVNPLKTPLNTAGIQFEQGQLGWYWFYGTFKPTVQQKEACYFISLTRCELGNQDIRSEMNLSIGETTIYKVTMCIGYEGKWYTPTRQFPCFGKYKTEGFGNMSFTALNLDNATFTVNFDGTVVKLNTTWDTYKIDATMTGVGLPWFNLPDGCALCTDTGTNYWSYTDMIVDATLTIDSKEMKFSNGDGWIDRQWGKGNWGRNYFFQTFNVIKALSSDPGLDLGKYIWINLHLPGEQYMIYQFLRESDIKNVGDETDCIYNRYSVSLPKPEWLKNVNIKVVQMDGIYGNKFEILNLPGYDTIILDGSQFGTPVVEEPISKSQHWNGSALLYDTKGNLIGTGFLEQSQFEDPKVILTDRIEATGLSSKYYDVFSGGQITVLQAIPSLYFFFYLIFLAVFLLAVLGQYSGQGIYHLFKKSSSSRKK